ncbi:MAG: hypothetical protein AAF035_09030 [Pseudomonadota bacterium]
MMYFLSGLLGLAGISVFILAIRTSYAIERVTSPRKPGSLPTYTNVVSSALGLGVHRDDHATWALVRRLRVLLLVVLGMMLLLGLVAASLS